MVEVANTVPSKHAVVLPLQNTLKTIHLTSHMPEFYHNSEFHQSHSHLSAGGAVPGSGGRHSFTGSAVMPVLSAET